MFWALTAALVCLTSGGASNEPKKVSVTEVNFRSPIDEIKWLGDDHSTVLLRTSDGHIFLSKDHGRAFDDITERVHSATAKISGIIVDPLSNSRVVTHSSSGDYIMSDDVAKTWRAVELSGNVKLSSWHFHPHKAGYIIATAWSKECGESGNRHRCNKEAYLSRDHGHTWSLILTYVAQIRWSMSVTKDIFFTYQPQQDKEQVRTSGWSPDFNFGKYDISSKKFSMVLQGGNKFIVRDGWTFVAVATKDERGVTMWVSKNGGEFKKAKFPFPGNLAEKSYTVLDSSEGVVAIEVLMDESGGSRGDISGNIYVSDATGANFHLSLANNVRARSGECEFHRVEGIDGIYIANYFKEAEVKVPNQEADKLLDKEEDEGELDRMLSDLRHRQVDEVNVRTAITFNKGGSWQRLKPPALDSLGDKIKCVDPDCALHLHGIAKYHLFAPYYSVKTAPGLLMGTGNVGESLSSAVEDANTYLSHDGGVTWREVHKGNYIYEFGDHGGLIVMADDSKKTSEVIFSWNEGHQWYDFDLGEKRITVENVVIEPTTSHSEFLIYGLDGGRGLLYHMDFKTLDLPACRNPSQPDSDTSDYYTWHPTGPDDSGSRHCLMGKTVSYVRRSPEAHCFNGRDFKRPSTEHICECTQNDFSCSFGFYRAVDSNECVPDPSGYSSPDCRQAHIVHVLPYFKTPGNACQGGWAPNTVPVLCTVRSGVGGDTMVTAVMTGLILFAFGGIAYISNDPELRQRVFGDMTRYVNLSVGDVGTSGKGKTVPSGGETETRRYR